MNSAKPATFIVTGANGGLGFETCRHLVRDGAERILLACRTEAKAADAKARLQSEFGADMGCKLEIAGGFDMLRPDTIAAAVGQLPRGPVWDVVFLQAGGVTYGKEWKQVEHAGQRIERTIFQNVLGGHVCFCELLKHGILGPGAKVVCAGGEGARGIPGLIACPSFDAPTALRDYVTVADPGRPYHEMNAMGVSKYASALWVQAAAERYGGALEFIWFTPGLTAGTGGLTGVGAVKQWMFETIGFPLMVALGKAQTAEQGGRKFADCLQGKIGGNGDLLGAPQGTALGTLQDQKPMNPALTDARLITEFWGIVEGLFGRPPELELARPTSSPVEHSQERRLRL